ncbi:hypothetical protein FKM82_020542 [Ascaphus truei]
MKAAQHGSKRMFTRTIISTRGFPCPACSLPEGICFFLVTIDELHNILSQNFFSYGKQRDTFFFKGSRKMFFCRH